MKSVNEFLIDKAKRDFGVLKKWTNLKRMSNEEVYENLRDLTAYHIQKMLDSEYTRLLDLLYQTDISEDKVRKCFRADKTSKEISIELADLYLNRLLEKWKTRHTYSTMDIKGDWD